jgi:transcriptional regulator with XRE-family HTH domain
MIERIREVINYSQLSAASFADTIGISRSGLTHLLTGRNQPSLDVAKKILAKYPEISTEWLIMGMGEMMRPEAEATPEVNTPAPEPEPPVKEQPVENSKLMRQTDLFGEYETQDNSQEDMTVNVEENALEPVEDELVADNTAAEEEKVAENAVPVPPVRAQEAPVRARKTLESKVPAVPVKRDKHQPIPQEKKLQKIVFFYDDHSFEIYEN